MANTINITVYEVSSVEKPVWFHGSIRVPVSLYLPIRDRIASCGVLEGKDLERALSPLFSNFTCNFPPDDERLERLIEVLEVYGLRPSYVPIEENNTERFLLQLQLGAMIDEEVIEQYGWSYTRGLGDFRCQVEYRDGQCYGKYNDSINLEFPFLSAGDFTYFVNDFAKLVIERNGFPEISFQEVKWDQPEKVPIKFWELKSALVMPPSVLPVADIGGWLDYFEYGAFPSNVGFKLDELEAMGDFGIAYCREVVGNPDGPLGGRHGLVVSARFRNMMKRMGLPMIFFQPVVGVE